MGFIFLKVGGFATLFDKNEKRWSERV